MSVPSGGGGYSSSGSIAPEILYLDKVKLLKGCFQPNSIEFLEIALGSNTQMSLTTVRERLMSFMPEFINKIQMEELYHTAKTIIYLCDNYASEFNNGNSMPDLKEHAHSVYSLGHGNINTKYNRKTGKHEFSIVYPENMDKRIESLKTTSITNETAVGCTSYHFPSYSAELEKIGKSRGEFSHNSKSHLRDIQTNHLEEYIKKLESKSKMLEKRIDDPDDDDDEPLTKEEKKQIQDEIKKSKTTIKEIEKIIKKTDDGKSKLMKTYSKQSLEIINVQFANRREDDLDIFSNSGIIYIPKIKGRLPKDFAVFINAYLDAKSFSGDVDSSYYIQMRTHSTGISMTGQSLIDTLTFDQILRFIDYCIEKRNYNKDYAFCIYKHPNAKYGSLAYEIVKQYVAQSGSEDMKLLFYANFCFDNIVFTTTEVRDKAHTSRILINNSEKLLEMLTVLEIMSCCGPHEFINSSCMTTSISEKDVIKEMSEYNIGTQHSQLSQSDFDYLFSTQNSAASSRPATPPFSPLSPLVIPNGLTLDDLATSPLTPPFSPLEDLATSPLTPPSSPSSPLVIPSKLSSKKTKRIVEKTTKKGGSAKRTTKKGNTRKHKR